MTGCSESWHLESPTIFIHSIAALSLFTALVNLADEEFLSY